MTLLNSQQMASAFETLDVRQLVNDATVLENKRLLTFSKLLTQTCQY
jgi:hypothetical protein